MNRNLASALALATTAAVAVALAALASGNSYGDDIGVDINPFTSSASRAEVPADRQGRPAAATRAQNESTY